MKRIISSLPLRVSILYAVIAGLWILFSDKLIEGLDSVNQLQTYKGWFFVLATAVLLYIIINKLFGQIVKHNKELTAAQEELHESKELLNYILDNIPQSIFWKDRNSVYLGSNKVFASIAGIESPEEILGKTDYDLPWLKEDADKYIKSDQDVIINNKIIKSNIEHLKSASGKSMIVSTTKIPLIDEQNNVFGILGVFDDITERKQAEFVINEIAGKFKSIFESMVEGVAIHEMVYDNKNVPVDYIITDVNPSFEKQTGIKKENIVGKRATEVYGVTEAPYLNEYAEVVATGIPYIFETYFTPMKKYFNISVNTPNPGYFVTVFQDITENKLAEEEIKKLNAELELRVIKRTKQLEAANKELEAFTYSVSHDLRSPLRAIDGFSKIVLEDYSNKFDEEGKRLLSIIRNNTRQMDTLITDLLSLSKVTRSAFKLARIDMKKMVSDIFNETLQNKDENKLNILISDLPNICCDPTLIRQVWNNLISNAVKYTAPKENRTIKVDYITHEKKITFFIQDNGVGFNPDYTHKLFDVFQRLHGTSEFEGTGVGLAIVDRIIKRHQGKVWGEGKINEGATFYFTLPKNKECYE